MGTDPSSSTRYPHLPGPGSATMLATLHPVRSRKRAACDRLWAVMMTGTSSLSQSSARVSTTGRIGAPPISGTRTGTSPSITRVEPVSRARSAAFSRVLATTKPGAPRRSTAASMSSGRWGRGSADTSTVGSPVLTLRTSVVLPLPTRPVSSVLAPFTASTSSPG